MTWWESNNMDNKKTKANGKLKNLARTIRDYSILASILGGMGYCSVKGCEYLTREHTKYVSFETHPVDQVFRNSWGYTIRWTNNKDIDEERGYSHYYSDRPKNIDGIPQEINKRFAPFESEDTPIVIRDLEDGARGFTEVLMYEHSRGPSERDNRLIVQIHLPKSTRVSPGIEELGKGRTERIQEIK